MLVINFIYGFFAKHLFELVENWPHTSTENHFKIRGLCKKVNVTYKTVGKVKLFLWKSRCNALLRIPRLTWEVVKRCRDVFRWISIGCVADNEAGFSHSSVPEKHALQQAPLAVWRPGGSGFVWRHRRRHQVTVIHDALLDRTAGESHTPNGVTQEKTINKSTL